MSFTDQKPRVVTTDDLAAHWSGYKDGSHFRCYLCGHKFKLGDTWRWVYDNDGDGAHAGNFMVCSDCDGPDVRTRWKYHVQYIKRTAWWLIGR